MGFKINFKKSNWKLKREKNVVAPTEFKNISLGKAYYVKESKIKVNSYVIPGNFLNQNYDSYKYFIFSTLKPFDKTVINTYLKGYFFKKKYPYSSNLKDNIRVLTDFYINNRKYRGDFRLIIYKKISTNKKQIYRKLIESLIKEKFYSNTIKDVIEILFHNSLDISLKINLVNKNIKLILYKFKEIDGN